MAELDKFKEVGAPFSNATEKVKVIYDFSKDGGAIGVKDIFKATEKVVVKSFYAKTLTPLTSAGAATVDVGNTDDLLDGVAYTAFTQDAIVVDRTNQELPMGLAVNDTIKMSIAAAALTGGKVEFCFEIEKI